MLNFSGFRCFVTNRRFYWSRWYWLISSQLVSLTLDAFLRVSCWSNANRIHGLSTRAVWKEPYEFTHQSWEYHQGITIWRSIRISWLQHWKQLLLRLLRFVPKPIEWRVLFLSWRILWMIRWVLPSQVQWQVSLQTIWVRILWWLFVWDWLLFLQILFLMHDRGWSLVFVVSFNLRLVWREWCILCLWNSWWVTFLFFYWFRRTFLGFDR